MEHESYKTFPSLEKLQNYFLEKLFLEPLTLKDNNLLSKLNNYLIYGCGAKFSFGGGEGRTPIGRARPVSPWGKPALGKKTRKSKRYSDIYIVN